MKGLYMVALTAGVCGVTFLLLAYMFGFPGEIAGFLAVAASIAFSASIGAVTSPDYDPLLQALKDIRGDLKDLKAQNAGSLLEISRQLDKLARLISSP